MSKNSGRKIYYILLLLTAIFSCMTPRAKIRYYDNHVKRLVKKYSATVSFKQDSSITEKENLAEWKKVSKKEIKQMIDTIELGTALTPDSFRVVQPPAITNGTALHGTLFIDKEHAYITNKNKIRYLKEHHVAFDSTLTLIEK